MTRPSPADYTGTVYATAMTTVQSYIDSAATQLATASSNANATGKTAIQNACLSLQNIAAAAETGLGQGTGTFAPSGGWGKGDHP